jgi:hypothetical protein
LVFRTFAVRGVRMVTGAGPQSKVTWPPRATAPTTAADVQPAGVPLPITRRALHTARPSGGGSLVMTRTTDDLFLESLEETLAILSDPEAMRGITEGREAIRGGDSILGVEPIRALRPAWA